MSQTPKDTPTSVIHYLETLNQMGVRHIPKRTRAVTDPAVAAGVVATELTASLSCPTSDASDTNSLEGLRAHIGDCRLCKLCHQRKNIVFGVGDPHARLMFVGEGPGADEDEQGIPFVGRAGQLLTKMIESMKLTREQVYIANVVKCRPPENRNPQDDEILACSPFLQQQIALIKPQVIVCLGKFAAQTLLKTQIPIGRLRGSFHDFSGIPLMPTFHPAYLLRNPEMKRPAWEDLKLVMQKLGMTP